MNKTLIGKLGLAYNQLWDVFYYITDEKGKATKGNAENKKVLDDILGKLENLINGDYDN